MAIGTGFGVGLLLGGALAARAGASRGGDSNEGGGLAKARRRRPGTDDDEEDGVAAARTRTPNAQTVGRAQPRDGASSVGNTNPPDTGQQNVASSQAARIAAEAARRRGGNLNRTLMLGERSNIAAPSVRLRRRTLIGL